MARIKVIEATNFLQKTRGLIGRNTPVPFLLRTRFGIHTFGLRFPIDVLILDKSGIVMGTKRNLLPNKLFFWNPKYDLVLELPQGFIDDRKIKKGDRINFY